MTPAIPLVKATFVMPFRVVMENNGIDADQYFKKFHLPLNKLNDGETLVPEKPFWQLINQVAIAEMIPDFGMQVAQASPWHENASLRPLLHGKQTLKAALETFCVAASQQSNVSDFAITEDSNLCWFENHGYILVSNDIQMELYRVTNMIELVQLATGKNWKPLKVQLMMDRNRVVEMNHILKGCELVFSQQRTAIAFPTGLLDATITTTPVSAQPEATDINETYTFHKVQDKNELIGALREVIKLYITEEDLSIDTIAAITGLSTRSLQRLMKKYAVSYNDLLNEARQHYATEKLRNPATKITDVACQLGYNDVAHFTRAFKRWSGMTPTQYRNQKVN